MIHDEFDTEYISVAAIEESSSGKSFRKLIINHLDENHNWSVVASEFKGYDSFQQWFESESLHADHEKKLYEIDYQWRLELEKTNKNKRRIADL